MKKIVLIALLLAATLPMSSCRRAAEKAREKIRIETVEKFERQGMTGAELTLRVVNGTGYKLALESASLEVLYAGSPVGTIRLKEGVGVERRATQSVTTRWQAVISDPLALYVLSRKVGEGDYSQVCVSYAIEGRGGPAPVKISREMVPLSEFLNTFGLSVEELKSYLKQ